MIGLNLRIDVEILTHLQNVSFNVSNHCHTELDRLLSKADSRRGSLLPGQTRSRAGSIVIGTGSRSRLFI